jgi:hypothetical protein
MYMSEERAICIVPFRLRPTFSVERDKRYEKK